MFALESFFFLFFLLTTSALSATTVSDSPTASPSTPSHPSIASAPSSNSSSRPHPSSPSTSTAASPHASPSSTSTALAPSSHSADSPASAPSSYPSPSSSLSPSSSKTPTSHSSSTLDPKQLTALQSLDIPTAKDPCVHPSPRNATVCDNSTPFRHLISLHLSDCSDDLSLSNTALKALSTLRSLSFTDCPISPVRFPSDLSLSLRSFSCVNSLKRLSAVWLSRFVNLTELVVSDVTVSGSGLYVVLGNMHNIKSLTVLNANVSGKLPRHLNPLLTNINLSGNNLKGDIPSSLTTLENLESLNLYSNSLTGEIPSNIGDLSSLKNLSLGSNSFSGSIPESISDLGKLVYLDLSSNQFNGTVPKFLSELRQLKYLNLEKNQFHGVVPFNVSFINRLEEFKVGGNSLLCYNSTVLSKKMKLGISPCDKHGMPVSPPAAKESSNSEDDTSDYSDSPDSNKTEKHHRGPNKVVLGIAIALASIVFLIIFLVLLSRKCC